MREIKFRAWDKFNKAMSGVSAEQLRSTNFNLFRENCEMMQYTGLKDKNGKEIYEGDILFDRYEIKEHEKHYMLPRKPYEVKFNEIIHEYMEGIFREYDMEIIGNVYENVDLLT